MALTDAQQALRESARKLGRRVVDSLVERWDREGPYPVGLRAWKVYEILRGSSYPGSPSGAQGSDWGRSRW